MKAQEWLDQNFADKQTKEIIFNSTEEKLTGDLTIENYSQLKEINLRKQELTFLKVINCPQLKKINVRNNKLNKLEIEGDNQISEIIVGENELTNLDLTSCSKIEELIVPDNLTLKEIKGLNLISIKNINIINTMASLGEELEELKQTKNKLTEIIKTYDKAGQERKLTFTEPIRTNHQIKVAIKRLLTDTAKDWKDYFQIKNQQEAENKYPLLSLCFRKPERRRRGQQVLSWIIEANESDNYEEYEELAKKWNDEKEYNATDDFDGSLWKLMEYLGYTQNKQLKKNLTTNYERN